MRCRHVHRVGLAAAILLNGCSPDKPAEAPQPTAVEERVESRASPPPSATPDAGVAKKEEEETDPAFADAPGKRLGKEEIRILMKALPLRDDAVRFEAIDKFLLLYAPYTSNKGLLREVRKSFRAAQSYLKVPLRAFSLSMNTGQLAGLLKDPSPVRYIFPITEALMDGVSRTRDVILDFYEQVRDQVSEGDQQLVFGQIGQNRTDSSISDENIRALANMRGVPQSRPVGP